MSSVANSCCSSAIRLLLLLLQLLMVTAVPLVRGRGGVPGATTPSPAQPPVPLCVGVWVPLGEDPSPGAAAAAAEGVLSPLAAGVGLLTAGGGCSWSEVTNKAWRLLRCCCCRAANREAGLLLI